MFVGEAFYGLIADTDPCATFFMVLGLVRGLGLATTNVRRRQAYGRDAAEGLAETAV